MEVLVGDPSGHGVQDDGEGRLQTVIAVGALALDLQLPERQGDVTPVRAGDEIRGLTKDAVDPCPVLGELLALTVVVPADLPGGGIQADEAVVGEDERPGGPCGCVQRGGDVVGPGRLRREGGRVVGQGGGRGHRGRAGPVPVVGEVAACAEHKGWGQEDHHQNDA